MSRPLDTDAAGRVVNMIGKPVTSGRGSVSGVGIVRKDTTDMPKAEKDGVYTLNGVRYKARKGAIVPEGAEFDAPVEERAEKEAPENRAKKAAPENRSKKAD